MGVRSKRLSASVYVFAALEVALALTVTVSKLVSIPALSNINRWFGVKELTVKVFVILVPS